jgi:hypothetical protein
MSSEDKFSLKSSGYSLISASWSLCSERGCSSTTTCVPEDTQEYLAAVFGEITTDQRPQILNCTTKTKESCTFFETYRACVLTLQNVPEWPLMNARLDLRLTELIQSNYLDNFPPRVFLAQSNTPSLGLIIKK